MNRKIPIPKLLTSLCLFLHLFQNFIACFFLSENLIYWQIRFKNLCESRPGCFIVLWFKASWEDKTVTLWLQWDTLSRFHIKRQSNLYCFYKMRWSQASMNAVYSMPVKDRSRSANHSSLHSRQSCSNTMWSDFTHCNTNAATSFYCISLSGCLETASHSAKKHFFVSLNSNPQNTVKRNALFLIRFL